MYNKGRRPWKRGPKLRYSVYKAEDNIEGEDDYEEWCRELAVNKGYDLNDFYAWDADPKHFWKETYDRMFAHWQERYYARREAGSRSPDPG
jgi:hypothetical protein